MAKVFTAIQLSNAAGVKIKSYNVYCKDGVGELKVVGRGIRATDSDHAIQQHLQVKGVKK